MIELADDFKQRAEEKLSTAVSGTFFKSNNARLLPSFDRGETDNDGKDQMIWFEYEFVWSSSK